jgi:general secretion pathway protein G
MGRRISKLKFQIPNLRFQISNCHRSNAGHQASGRELAKLRSPIPHGEPGQGFTLLELMVVLTILLILATMSMPLFNAAIVHAREAVLKDDLYTLRKLIDEYTLDKQKPPTSLSDLVDAGYLRAGVPVDPFTGSSDTWQTDTEEVPTSPSQAASGIVNVHSGSDGTALDGTAYSSW